MIVNTMYVFYDKNCLPYKDKERQVHYPILQGAFQGASNTTKIRFYIEQIGDIDATWIAVSKLPNGKIGSQLLEPNYDSEVGENYVEMSLTSFYTQAKGDLYVSLQGFENGEITYDSEEQIFTTTGNPIIQATGSVKLAINYATQGVGSGEDEEITPEDIYGAIGEKLDKGSTHYLKVVESLTAINTTANENYLNENDIVYDKATKRFYKLSGSYPSFVANEIQLDLTNSELTLNILNVGEIKITNFSDITNGSNQSLTDYIDSTISGAISGKTDKTYVDNNFAHSLDLSIDSNYDLVVKLLDKNGIVLSQDDIDLPLESIVVSATYYDTYTYGGVTYQKVIVIVLATTDIPTIVPVGDLVSGLVSSDQLATALASYVLKSTTIAGIDLQDNITAQELTDNLVYMNNTTDIDYVMGD